MLQIQINDQEPCRRQKTLASREETAHSNWMVSPAFTFVFTVGFITNFGSVFDLFSVSADKLQTTIKVTGMYIQIYTYIQI